MDNFDNDINNLQTLDFENPQKWFEYANTLYPYCKTSTRKLIRLAVERINSSEIQRILNSNLNKIQFSKFTIMVYIIVKVTL